MCGIVGFSWEDKDLIRQCARTIAHRGPDGEGYYTDSHVSLGHRRLSIIDLSERGKQPMSNEDGSVWIVFNGEIYNYKELRVSLEKKGHKFSSGTDTEVIVHAYEEFEGDCVKKFMGMFAFCIWDSKKRVLFLARDHVGKKPLYFHWDGERFIFASEIKAIIRAGVERAVNMGSLHAFLGFNYIPGEQTFFKGVRKLLPCHTLTLKDGKVNTSQYWDIREDILERDEDYFVRELESKLEEATKLRMFASDVPIGAFLSGGIDSSSIVAMAGKHVDYKMHTFSVGFGDFFSELKGAMVVAEHLGTSHHEFNLDPKKVLRELPRIAWQFDEPVGDPGLIPNFFLSQEARKYVKVVLAGEGGDELFGGYQHYKAVLGAHNLRIPKIARLGIGAAANTLPTSLVGGRKRRYALFHSKTSLEDMYFASVRFMSDREVSWLARESVGELNSLAVKPSPGFRKPLNILLAMDFKNTLPEKYLMKADKATMANSIEERLPLIDRNVVDFAFRIPPWFKIRGGQEKYILRKAMQRKLPGAIISKKKQGFGTPIEAWMAGEMGEAAKETLEKSKIVKDYFSIERVRGILNGRKGNYRQALLLWLLYSLCLWENTLDRR